MPPSPRPNGTSAAAYNGGDEGPSGLPFRRRLAWSGEAVAGHRVVLDALVPVEAPGGLRRPVVDEEVVHGAPDELVVRFRLVRVLHLRRAAGHGARAGPAPIGFF